jgi:anti-sigma factor RsiW
MSPDHLTPETIGAIVDGELMPADAAQTREHLKQCHACALKVIDAQRLKSATSRAANNFRPSASTLARFEAQVRGQPAKAGRVLPWRKVAWTSIAAGILVLLAVIGWRQARESDSLRAELLDQHLAVLSDSSTPQVLSSDRHTVKPWFQGKLPFSFNLPEPNLLPADSTLLGADLTYVKGRPTALLLFAIHKHRASVFVTQSGQLPALFPGGARSGFQMIHRSAAELDFVAVSDVNRPDLEALMTVLTKAQ